MSVNTLRQPTLQTLGLGSVLEIFRNGELPVQPGDLVDRVFGGRQERGSLVISGANGIVGAGKAMQLGARLQPYGIPIIALDFPGVPDGIGQQYPGLRRAFGTQQASKIMENVVRLSYDGSSLPPQLMMARPRFLLEAIPEILKVKKTHYETFRAAFPGIEIRSVTSGFPSSELGVGIAHPAFPHEINKIWEVVEPEPSAITQLLWVLGLIPIPVSDHWSFVLDVLFCGLTLAGVRYHRFSNMPFWKIDKYIRRLLGPNPFRAHDVIGAKGANFLTWSCLHHLAEHYGELFTPPSELVERKESGQNWYPLNHFRPMVNWTIDENEEEDFNALILGPLCQMVSLLLHEERAHYSHINAIGELCAQFQRGILATIRSMGGEEIRRTVEKYHGLHQGSGKSCWYPEVFESMDRAEWLQLYVNAEHDGNVGVITIGRESYNGDVDDELNRAIDWLRAEGIERVIITGDFHLSSQMVGADTAEFFPALADEEIGRRISTDWSKTARRLYDEFRLSVGFISGKRCLGGFLELMMHCHYLVSEESSLLGMPEVTLPVVPGMEGCHWPFRKATSEHWSRILALLLGGESVRASDAVGWLIDSAGPMDTAIRTVWKIAGGEDHGVRYRELNHDMLPGLEHLSSGVGERMESGDEEARRAILQSILESCGTTLSEALSIQARHSSAFMVGSRCKRGMIGAAFTKTMTV